jgi:sialic acid synthase SpsE
MYDPIRLGDRLVGNGHSCFVIAEIGQNHNGDIEIAKKLIDVAKEAGADSVKFCKRNLETELTADAAASPYEGPQSFGKTYGEHRAFLEFSFEQHRELRDYAKDKGIIYFSSVCDPVSADEMEALDVPMFKVASRDLTNLPLLDHIAKKKRPIIMSTGMSGIEEIHEAMQIVRRHNQQIILLQCTSQYPTEYHNVNLRTMETLRREFDVLVGFSGHTVGIVIPVIAVALGAVVVEKHITLARVMKGTDHAGALEPEGLRRMIRDIRNAELALGSPEKILLSATRGARKKLARSIVLARSLPKGTILQESDLIMKSPGTGLMAREMPRLIGMKLKDELAADHMLSWNDVE